MSSQSEIASAMTSLSKVLIERAEALAKQAQNIAEMDPESFEGVLGSQWSGPGWVTQIQEEVRSASVARSSDTWAVERALVKALVEAQRKEASA